MIAIWLSKTVGLFFLLEHVSDSSRSIPIVESIAYDNTVNGYKKCEWPSLQKLFYLRRIIYE